MENRIESLNKDNSHSWVRISHGLIKLVTNLNVNEQETSVVQFEDYALRLNAGDFACRSKAKAKPQQRDSASSSTKTIPIGERTWEPPSRLNVPEIDKRFLLGCESTNLSVARSDKDKDADENVDADRVRTGRPVGSEQSIDLFTQREEKDIDFRVSRLPHAVVNQAENSRVRELVKKIESHPHRQALQADLQQNNAYNPFSEKSKKMIRDMGNVELFELCETIPKVQCSECLLHWNRGIVYCTCGHLLKESAANRGVIQYTLDLLSIPNYVTKKGRPHGHRYGKTPQQKEYHQAHNLKKDASRKVFKGYTIDSCEIPNFVQPCSNMIEMKKCVSKWDDLADKDVSHYKTESEYFRYKQNWFIKKGRPDGNRHGQTEAQKEHFIAHNARKISIKKGF